MKLQKSPLTLSGDFCYNKNMEPSEKKSERKPVGGLIAIVIILIVILVGALYFAKQILKERKVETFSSETAAL